MRKLLLFLFLLSSALSAQAQFGYYSTSRVLEALPQYAQAQLDYQRLCQRCEKEIEHNEKELTRQYVAFIDGHRDFPEPILRKRQGELQRMVDNSVEFRKQLKMWLAEAQDSLYASSYNALDAALERVCVACNLDYAIDSDIMAYRYINPNKGVDITRMVTDAALYPDKPVTELDGYDSYAKQYLPVEPEPVEETVTPVLEAPEPENVVPAVVEEAVEEPIEEPQVQADSDEATIAIETTVQESVATDSIATQGIELQQAVSNDTIQ